MSILFPVLFLTVCRNKSIGVTMIIHNVTIRDNNTKAKLKTLESVEQTDLRDYLKNQFGEGVFKVNYQENINGKRQVKNLPLFYIGVAKVEKRQPEPRSGGTELAEMRILTDPLDRTLDLVLECQTRIDNQMGELVDMLTHLVAAMDQLLDDLFADDDEGPDGNAPPAPTGENPRIQEAFARLQAGEDVNKLMGEYADIIPEIMARMKPK